MAVRTRSNMVVASVEGALLFWIDGEFSGDDQELLTNVRRAADTHLEMLLTADGPVITADDSDAMGATAALLAARTGRVRIEQAPPSVMNLYPEDEDEGLVLEIDGVVQNQESDVYTTDEMREIFEVPQNDPRVKLVTK